VQIDISFRNEEQKEFAFHKQRNGLFDGGFGNGKTYVACQRAMIHLATFPNYGMAIARQKYKVLRMTTMKTFQKICPPDFVYRHDEQVGFTILLNKSFIYWIHLDTADEQDLRGLEFNSALIDQAEETRESLYLVFDARVGRWDKAQVPLWLLESKIKDLALKAELIKIPKDSNEYKDLVIKSTEWPRHPQYGNFLVPNYMDCLCNPSNEDEFHWTYRRYNPESPERQSSKTHFYIHRETDASMYDEHTYEQMLNRDEEWINKYVKGKTGTPRALIHKVLKDSIIDPEEIINEHGQEFWDKFLNTLKLRAALYRILDHGDTGVTCCTWEAAINQVHIFYREYYIASTLISDNRINISDLSFDEEYVSDFADPSIFKVTRQKVNGQEVGFYTIAKEYADTYDIDAPPIYWQPADNNEFATRNRINELLRLNLKFMHPITKMSPAPGIYFIKKCTAYPYGCREIINQTKAQRRELLSEENGKKVYSEARDKGRVDHAYDTLRYSIGMHNTGLIETKPKPPARSFAALNRFIKRKVGSIELSQGN
jgi:hypothetical protein